MGWTGQYGTSMKTQPVSHIFELISCQRGSAERGGGVSLPTFEKGGGGTGGPTCVTRSPNGLI